jgi:hypothetical protein
LVSHSGIPHQDDDVTEQIACSLPPPATRSSSYQAGANPAHGHAFRPLTILAALTGLVLIALSIFVCYGFADGWHESWELRE